jgi:hypothetical protein
MKFIVKFTAILVASLFVSLSQMRHFSEEVSFPWRFMMHLYVVCTMIYLAGAALFHHKEHETSIPKETDEKINKKTK